MFFHASDLPPAGDARDDLLMRIMGSPDALQIDGMGGTTSSTSKVIVVDKPHADGTVPYSFAQIGIDAPIVDWRGNCGNLTTAVAPFALNEGLINLKGEAPLSGEVTVKLLNVNTGVRVEADLWVTPHPGSPSGALAATTGSCSVSGVPGTGSPITTRYFDPAGAVLGSLLPLENALTVLETPEGPLRASLVDATNPYLFLLRADVQGADRPVADLRTDQAFLDRIEAIRSAAAVAAGAAPNAETARTLAPTTPRLLLLEPGEGDVDGAHVGAISFAMGQLHRGIPMTAALCLAAARGIPGTVVAEVADDTSDPDAPDDTGTTGTRWGAAASFTRIKHPLGVTEVNAKFGVGTRLLWVGATRTARTLMRGHVYPRL